MKNMRFRTVFFGLFFPLLLLFLPCSVSWVYTALLLDARPVPVVILDAGHGGEDSGTSSESGVREKDLNLAITLELGRVLSEAGVTVLYTRTEDKLLYREEENVKGLRKIGDLKARVAFAAEHPGAVFVSIHMNAFGDPSCEGLQVFYGTENEGSPRLAKAIGDEVRATLQPSNKRQAKSGKGIYVLEHVSAPAVLIECGFLSNPSECERLSEKEYQKRLCFSIKCAILKYIGEL